MSLAFTATVTRSDLGLSSLNINDHIKYITTTQIMGGQVTWQRNSVSSPYVDGDVTISRRRPSVNDVFVVDVIGANHATIRTNLQALVAAFLQDKFNIIITLDGATYQYQCETSDYSIEWNHAKIHDKRITAQFNVMRKPIAVSGV